MPYISVFTLTVIGLDNGLSPGRRQAIIWTNVGILLTGPLGTNFIEIVIKILTFSFKKMRVKMSSGKCRPSCLGFNLLMMCMHIPYTLKVTILMSLVILQRYNILRTCKSNRYPPLADTHVQRFRKWAIKKPLAELTTPVFHKVAQIFKVLWRCNEENKI